MGDSEIIFGPFRLDCNNQQLWRGAQQLALQPKPLAVLQYLAQHAGRLITKEELLQQVWVGTQVTPKALTVCIHAIRAILGDSEATPQFIATQGKHGYRFIGEVTNSQLSVFSTDKAGTTIPQRATDHWQLTTHHVGREKELAQLQEWYAAASAGSCQLVFVSGESGIGKTTLVTRFLAGLRPTGQAWISVGQGVQHHGTGEAYLPVMTVLSQFARGADQEELRVVLQQHAPSWLVRLPALRQEGESAPPAKPLPVVTSQRLMWELGEAFRVLTERRPIVLVFDDLQWSDTATVEWLAYLARWSEPLRLLIIGAYRPADIIASGHPLHAITQELRGKGQSAELRLELLNRQQVQDYCTQRFPKSSLPARVITLLHRRTDGNPLFLVRLVEYLVQHGFLTHTEGRWQLTKPVSELDGKIPNELQGMIEQQIEQLSVEEQRVLEVAGVVGAVFASAVVAAGVDLPAEHVEAVCDELVRKKQVLDERGVAEWPDGTVAACYGFQHALFRDVVYGRLGAGRRVRLHRAILERLEAGYGSCAAEIASELAVHCAQGRDYYKGAKHHLHAAHNVLRLSAYRQAITHCQQGLELLAHVPATPERDRQELALRLSFHEALSTAYGHGAQEVEENLTHAQALARTVNDERALVLMVISLGRIYINRSDRAETLRIAEEEACLVKRISDPALTIELHTQLGTIRTFSADYARARAHQTQALTLYTTAERESLIFSTGMDPLLIGYFLSGLDLWLSGWPEQSIQQQRTLLVHVAQRTDAFSNTVAGIYAATLMLLRGDFDEARQFADQGAHLAMQHGYSMYLAMGKIVQGGIAVRGGDRETGLHTLQEALPDYRATRSQSFLPVFLSFLAEALSRCGKTEEAFATIAEALRLSETSLDVYWEAELYRLKGELILQSRVQSPESRVTRRKSKVKGQKAKMSHTQHPAPSTQAEAEECFHKAIAIARQQGAKSLELRAVMSLARLWQTQSKKNEAHPMLAETYHWFTEGFDTQDLQEAKALLTQLASPSMTQFPIPL